MLCCNPVITPFIEEAVTTVVYTGSKPVIEVAYLQSDGSLLVSGIFTSITDNNGSYTIDHGAPATGIIKLLM
jgi:hypothetical protein